jgi:ABC-type nitrate/sulfonate/bicarbonate transport system substrate-binding protein
MTPLGHSAAHELSREQGWRPDGIDVIPLGSEAAQIAALRTGEIDGMANDVASAEHLQQEGVAHTFIDFGQVAPHFINHVTFASDQIIQRHPQDVRAFLAAWFETIAWMRAHKAETVKLAAPVMNQSPVIVAKAYDVVMPTFSSTGRFDPTALAVLRRSFVEMGFAAVATRHGEALYRAVSARLCQGGALAE